MARVLEECEHVSADFSADPVHDLRVALRRCRSMADGMIAMDPDPDWKAMKKSGKRLFQRLGALRDVQVMMEWIEKLDLDQHAVRNVARTLLSAKSNHEQEHTESSEVLDREDFDAITKVPQIDNSRIESINPIPPNPAQVLLAILKAREAE